MTDTQMRMILADKASMHPVSLSFKSDELQREYAHGISRLRFIYASLTTWIIIFIYEMPQAMARRPASW